VKADEFAVFIAQAERIFDFPLLFAGVDKPPLLLWFDENSGPVTIQKTTTLADLITMPIWDLAAPGVKRSLYLGLKPFFEDNDLAVPGTITRYVFMRYALLLVLGLLPLWLLLYVLIRSQGH
jgi:hypothetical protein